MRYLIWVIALVLVAGCSFKETNELIARENTDRFAAFTYGMAEADSEGARIAIAMAFAGGMGMQKYYRQETAKDYANAFMPYVSLLAPYIWGTSGDDSQAMSAGRDLYVGSVRSDATVAVDSAVQEYLVSGDGASVQSNDQEMPVEITEENN